MPFKELIKESLFANFSFAWLRLFAAASIVYLLRETIELSSLAQVNALGGDIRWLTTMGILQAVAGFYFGVTVSWIVFVSRRIEKILALATLCVAVLLGIVAAQASLYIFVVLISLISGVATFISALEAIVEPKLLKDDISIAKANSLRGFLRHILQIITPLGAGILLALISPGEIFLLSALLMTLPFALFLSVSIGKSYEQERPVQTSLVNVLRESINDIRTYTELKLFFITEILIVLILGMQGPLIFTFLVRELNFEPSNFAYFISAIGIGGAIGAIGVFFFPKLRALGIGLILILLIFDGLALLGFSYSSDWIHLLGFAAGMGLLGGLFSVIMRTFLQTIKEEGVRNRMIGLYYSIFDPLVIIGLSIVFIIVTFFSSREILIISAFTELIVGVVAFGIWVFSRIQNQLNIFG